MDVRFFDEGIPLVEGQASFVIIKKKEKKTSKKTEDRLENTLWYHNTRWRENCIIIQMIEYTVEKPSEYIEAEMEITNWLKQNNKLKLTDTNAIC